jgi:hypothetical protein
MNCCQKRPPTRNEFRPENRFVWRQLPEQTRPTGVSAFLPAENPLNDQMPCPSELTDPNYIAGYKTIQLVSRKSSSTSAEGFGVAITTDCFSPAAQPMTSVGRGSGPAVDPRSTQIRYRS